MMPRDLIQTIGTGDTHTYMYIYIYIHATMHALHYITLHYITLHYITLHCITNIALHYTTRSVTLLTLRYVT